MCRVANHQTRLPRATSSLALNAFRDGASTTSLGNLFQCNITLCVKNFLLISNLNLPSQFKTIPPCPLTVHPHKQLLPLSMPLSLLLMKMLKSTCPKTDPRTLSLVNSHSFHIIKSASSFLESKLSKQPCQYKNIAGKIFSNRTLLQVTSKES